jgi:hypothetical protein
MIHLTQIDLPFDTVAQLRLSDSYAWHQAVRKGLPRSRGRKARFPDTTRSATGGIPVDHRFASGIVAAFLVPLGFDRR